MSGKFHVASPASGPVNTGMDVPYLRRDPEKTTVLFIHHGGGVGGAPVSMIQLAESLDRDEFDTHLVFTQDGPIIEMARNQGLSAEMVSLPSAFFYSMHVPLRFRSMLSFVRGFRDTAARAEQLVRDLKPDIVHLNTSVLIPAAIGVRRTGVPIVWHVREVPGANRWIRHRQTSTIMEIADQVIATSESVRQAFPVPQELHLMPNALELEYFNADRNRIRSEIRRDLRIDAEAPVVVIVGSVQAVKGHFLLVKAVSSLIGDFPALRIVVVAGGVPAGYASSRRGRIKRLLGVPLDNFERMKRQVRRAGLVDQFIFTGFRGDIPDILAACDVLVFPTQQDEGFGRPLIEGMAAGLPVLATDQGPARAILDDDAGVVVPTGSADSLAKGIRYLLENRQEWPAMAAAGRRCVRDHFDMAILVERVSSVYREVSMKPHIVENADD